MSIAAWQVVTNHTPWPSHRVRANSVPVPSATYQVGHVERPAPGFSHPARDQREPVERDARLQRNRIAQCDRLVGGQAQFARIQTHAHVRDLASRDTAAYLQFFSTTPKHESEWFVGDMIAMFDFCLANDGVDLPLERVDVFAAAPAKA